MILVYLFTVNNYVVDISFDVDSFINLLRPIFKGSGKRILLITSIHSNGSCTDIMRATIGCSTSGPEPFLQLSILVGHVAQAALRSGSNIWCGNTTIK